MSDIQSYRVAAEHLVLALEEANKFAVLHEGVIGGDGLEVTVRDRPELVRDYVVAYGCLEEAAERLALAAGDLPHPEIKAASAMHRQRLSELRPVALEAERLVLELGLSDPSPSED